MEGSASVALELECEELSWRNGDCINNAVKGQYENEEGGMLLQHLWLEKDLFSHLPSVSHYAVKLQFLFPNVSRKDKEMQSGHVL